MKFEITSFVAALVVYVIRLRVQYVTEPRPLHSCSYLESRSHRFMPEVESQSTQPEGQMNFARGCSRAV